MSNFVKASPTEGNFAHIHAVHYNLAAGNAYVGEAGEVSFIICDGYMAGVIHDGICRGGIARWPMFNTATDFTVFYDAVNLDGDTEEEPVDTETP